MKVLLLGRSGAGKSTVAPNVGRAFGLTVLEVDDEATKLNGGVWPETEEAIDALFDRITPKVLAMDTILFVTSWLSVEEIAAFYERGFYIVELHAAFGELVARKRRRGDSLDDGRFYENYRTYQSITDDAASKNLFHLSLDTTGRSPAEVEQTIIERLRG